jgi:hypothetical protein
VSGIPLPTPRQRIEALISGDFDLDAKPDFYGDGPVRRLEERPPGTS